ncbi:MAG: hypothetical protein WCW47_00745 [Candidatus Paceibacterota bacterium]|jgi:hypothetical protein
MKKMNHLIPSTGKQCSNCGRDGLSFMHPNYLCDYCYFSKNIKFPDSKNKMSENNFGVILGGIFGLILLAFFGYWIFSVIFSNYNNSSEECGQGYHIEQYVTSYGETISNCFKN